MTRGALMYGLGISSTRWDAASKAVSPNVDWRRPRMNAIPSGHWVSASPALRPASLPHLPARLLH